MRITKLFWSLIIAGSASLITVQADNKQNPIENSEKTLTGINKAYYVAPERNEPYLNVTEDKSVNLIFMIGDGMGLNQISLAQFIALGTGKRLHMERLPVTGICWNSPANNLVTDSAAAATALSTGTKTKNGMIGIDSDEKTMLTLLELAKTDEKSAGMVVTSTISHATPAGFSAHQNSRNDQTSIAKDIATCGADVLMGGGKSFWLPDSSEGKRKDGLNLIEEAKKHNYEIVLDSKNFEKIKGHKVLALLQDDALTTKTPEPSLAEMTAKAISILSQNKKGFFLMVEGSQIDWACHANDAETLVRQTLLFDMAVKEAMDFAQKDGHTLVIVTADHETGGLVVKSGNLADDKVVIQWSLKNHTPSFIPVFAFGPGSLLFTGVYDNTDIPKKISKLWNVKNFPQEK